MTHKTAFKRVFQKVYFLKDIIGQQTLSLPQEREIYGY